jgi:hypothetical protein
MGRGSITRDPQTWLPLGLALEEALLEVVPPLVRQHQHLLRIILPAPWEGHTDQPSQPCQTLARQSLVSCLTVSPLSAPCPRPLLPRRFSPRLERGM